MGFEVFDNNHTMKNKNSEYLQLISEDEKSLCGGRDGKTPTPFAVAPLRAVADMGGRPIVVVCFGTTAISGDALGPRVGSLLRDKYNVPAFVYGTQEQSVNGKNMLEWIEFIKTVHSDALFIAVDASLGARDKVGQILLRSDGVCPAAIKGKRARFGDVGILAVVAENGRDPLMQLMSVSPLYIDDLADKIGNMLQSALNAG